MFHVHRSPITPEADMQSILVLTTWVALGALSSFRFGPTGSWPVAMIFGPLWLPVAMELQDTPRSSESESQRRLEQLGFVHDGDR